MENIIELKTERLLLRQWQLDDYPLFAKMNADPIVMEFYPELLNSDASNLMASKLESLIADRSWGLWAVELLDQSQFIGFVGLHEPHYDLPMTPCVEIGWRLSKDSWGKGYATEAAKAALDFAFQRLELEEVYSFTSVVNFKSEAVMKRLGMKNLLKNFNHPIVPVGHNLSEHVLYKMTKEQWKDL